MPNKRDWRKGKGVKLIAFFFLSKLREYEETELQNKFKAGEFTYDEVLIRESSKPIFQENKVSLHRSHIHKKPSDIMLFINNHQSERNVNLIYLTLLKFKGLIRYMNFQDLVNDDIRQISCFITHKFFSKGQYLFRQYDSSDAMYGVISGKVDIRLISAFDYTKKFLNALSKGEEEEEETQEINHIIPVENFMSDLEEDDEVSDAADSIELEEEDEDSEIEFGQKLKENVIKNLIIQENMDNNINNNEDLMNNKGEEDNNKNIENKNNNDNKNINNDNNKNNQIDENIINKLNNNIENDNKKSHKKSNLKRPSINEEFLDNITDIEITIRQRKKIQTTIQKESKNFQKLKNSLSNKKKVKITSNQKHLSPIKSARNSPKKNPIRSPSKSIKSFKSMKSKNKSPKRHHIVKAIKKHQTPVNENMTDKELADFILEFELSRAQLSEGMCFGEWGILYCIPRTTSIYCLADTDLFCLKKKYFDKYLAHKFIACDMKKIKFILSRIPTLKRDYKMGKMLTKIVPIFCERGDIIYTPFDKAKILYIVYKGECALYKTKVNYENKNEFLLNLDKLQMIFRLNPGGMAGLESCIKDGNYTFCLMVTKPMSILYKVELDFMLSLYKDFRDDLIPLYYEQKKVIDQLIKNYETTTQFCKLKNKIFREKEKMFYDELHKNVLRPSSSKLNTYQFKVNVKDFNPKVSYNKYNQKQYSKYNSLMTIQHTTSFPKVKLPSFFAKMNKKNEDIIFITNKRTSIFNIRSCKTKFKNKIKTKLILNESHDNSNEENKKTKRTDTESDTLYTKKFQLFKKYNYSKRTANTISITSNTYDRELTNTINSNYTHKSGIKYFKSGKYDLPLVG